jgi:glycine C-acetyltransferase
MSKLDKALEQYSLDLISSGRAKGKEQIVTHVIKADDKNGPRYKLEGSNLEFIKMNSNSYLGLSMHPSVVGAEEAATRQFGVGPGAVRFISGSYKVHTDLEEKLAEFHGREAAMIFSSAYVTSLGVISSLTTNDTVLISDELNHNCIINAMRMSRPALKLIYKHNNVEDLEQKLKEAKGKGKRCLVITDGIFSMRGDHAPLDQIKTICKKAEADFNEGVTLVVDDSHGVGACGENGRGTEELTSAKSDVLIGTLGKAFGVNGGYVTGSKALIDFLRESAPTYIYSNPITVSESAAALKSIQICDSKEGKERLLHLKNMTNRFREGLLDLGLETIPGEHPVVPLMVRDTQKTAEIVQHLLNNGVLATGLNFPVVPKGQEEIRFQINADHTARDIDKALGILKQFSE